MYRSVTLQAPVATYYLGTQPDSPCQGAHQDTAISACQKHEDISHFIEFSFIY